VNGSSSTKCQQKEELDVRNTPRTAIVITHTGARQFPVDVPWLEKAYQIDASDWIVLSEEGWRSVANGDPLTWNVLERKLLIGFYVSRPELITVIGHPVAKRAMASRESGQSEVRRIVRRISLLVPASVLGFWTDEGGWLEEIFEPDDLGNEGPTELTEPETVSAINRWQFRG
jgi:hypothetical protein